jgi:hypothetical protein
MSVGYRLYVRVADEAKTRYNRGWMRSPDACKKWKDGSDEAQLFCAATIFVNSIEHIGWCDDNRFKAVLDRVVSQDPRLSNHERDASPLDTVPG